MSLSIKEFLEHVDKFYCGLHMDPITTDHIYQATRQTVQLIVKAIGEKRTHLNSNEIISVGSFIEGTKICSPNEFDFMVVLDFLSKNVRVESTDGCQPGYMVAFLNACSHDITMISMIRLLYETICCVHHEGLWESFVDALSSVIETFTMKKYVTPKGYLVIKGSKFLSLKLEFHKFKNDYTGPYMGLCDQDFPKETSFFLSDIDVDVMPAVAVNDFSVLSALHGFPCHVTAILGSPRFHLVCKKSGQYPSAPYLNISHATTEVFLIKHLHPVHRKCYKVLKYLLTHGMSVNHPLKPINLSSYWYKNAVLYHEYDKLCSGSPDIVACCIDIIRYIRARLREGFYPPFLMRTTNIWGHCYKCLVFYSWRPKDIPKEICTFDWCVVLWFHLWRQFLAQALIIFRKVAEETTDSAQESDTSGLLDESLPDPIHQSQVLSHEVAEQSTEPVQSETSCLTDDSLPGPIHHSQEALQHKAEQTIECAQSKASGLPHDSLPGQEVLSYIPHKFDAFLAEFETLRNDALNILTEYPKSNINSEIINTAVKVPSKRIWDLVLPSFPEYLSLIESICNRNVSIPKENFEDAMEFAETEFK